MTDRLTDAELLDIVRRKSVEQLTDDERSAIAVRLEESPEFLETLVERFDMAEFVEAVLQADTVAVEATGDVTVAPANTNEGRGLLWGAAVCAVLTGCVLLLLAVGVFDRGDNSDGADAKQQQAANQEDAKSKKSKRSKDKKSKSGKPAVAEKKPETVEPKVVDPETPSKLVTAKPVVVREPWEAALDATAPVRPFVETQFERPVFGPERQFPGVVLRRWIGAVPGQTLVIQDRNTQKGRYASFVGSARLKAPWPDDAVLRLGLFDLKSIRLSFWNGTRGVSLRFYPTVKPGVWAAFGVTREGKMPRPTKTTLLTTDSGRHARSGLGTFEVRHQNGSLVVTTGDVRLITVPFAAPPEDVYLEGTASVSVLEMYRGEAALDDVTPPAPNLLVSDKPAALPWATEIVSGAETVRQTLSSQKQPDATWQTEFAAGATLAGAKDGAVELVSKSATPIAVATSLQRAGLYEVILKIAHADPGTGFFLGDANGRPLLRIGFYREQKTGQTTFGYGKVGSGTRQVSVREATQLAAYTGSDQWLRLVWGVGTLKVWVSGDGVHWGRVLAASVVPIDGVFSSVGLYADGVPAGKQPDTKRISIAHLEVRELTGVTGLVAEEIREQVPNESFLAGALPSKWLLRVLQSRPADVPLAQWRRAWVIKTLETGTTRALARHLLTRLAEESVTLDRPAFERIRTLDEIAILLDTQPGGYGLEMAAVYDRLGIALAEVDEEGITERWPSVLVRAPVWTQATWDVLPPSLTQFHLMRHVYAGEWESVRGLCHSVRFWARTADPDWKPTATGIAEQNLCDWADAVSSRHLPYDDVRTLPLLPRNQRHPLAWEVGKEGYNVMAEFELALRSEAFEDAAQIVSTSGATDELGMLPDARDDELLVSFPRAVATAMAEHPLVRAAMQKKFGSLGRLRVRQAISDGDIEFVQSATTRYYGTSAALAAHRWLGDRELASGRFVRALEHYKRLARDGSDDDRKHVASRMQLVSALLGKRGGEAVSGSIDFGEASLDTKQFAALVAELSARAANDVTTPTVTAANSGTQSAVLAPGGFDAIVRSAFQGNTGTNPGQYRAYSWDWLARELGVAADDKRFYISNRFQLSAYDVVSGKQLWTAALGKEQGDARHWPLTAMRPVIAGERVFARRVTQRGTELVCFDATSGAVKWRQRPNNHIASDPVFVGGRLVALLATIPLTQFIGIEVASFDPATGELLTREPLLRLRDDWYQKPPCSILAIEDGLIVAVGGSVARCDVRGRLQWLRTQTWLPRTLDLKPYEVHVATPIVAGDHVFVAQPHACSVLCLDRETGRERWRRGAPGLQRVLGIAAGRLVYRTINGLTAVDAASGQPVWKRDVPELLAASSVGDSNSVMFAMRDRRSVAKAWPVLVWLNAQTGKELGRSPLRALNDKAPMLGPLFAAGGKTWSFYGKGPADMRRDVVELVPNPAVRLQPPRTSDVASWLLPRNPATAIPVSDALDGWETLSSVVPPKDLAAFRGEQNVIVTQVAGTNTTRLVRRVDVPSGGKPRLELRVGHLAAKSWRLTVAVDAAELLHRDINDAATGKTGWLSMGVNLSAYRGRSVWLVVSQSAAESPAAVDAYWKRLEFRAD